MQPLTIPNKEKYLKENYPFTNIPALTDKKQCIHCSCCRAIASRVHAEDRFTSVRCSGLFGEVSKLSHAKSTLSSWLEFSDRCKTEDNK